MRAETFEELAAYVRGFTNFGDNQGDYDTVGVAVLLSALIDNLRENGTSNDLACIGEIITAEQTALLRKLVKLSEDERP